MSHDALNVQTPVGVFEGNGLAAIRYKVEFVVRDFLNLPPDQKILLKSPLFFVGNSNEYQARIVVYYACKCAHDPTNHCRKPYGCTYLELKFKDREMVKGIKGIRMKRIGNKTQHCIYSGDSPVTWVGEDPIYGVCISMVPYIYKDGLFDHLKAGSFTLSCEITLNVRVAAPEGGDVVVAAPEKHLVEDISQLLIHGDLSDVTLVVGEGVFSVHKAILGARSPVFQRMFQTDMVENKSNVVRLIDVSREVLQSLLVYIYTGNVPNVDSLGEGLLDAAEKYQLDGLKRRCEIEIAARLTVDNASKVFALANMYKAKLLKTRSVTFIKEHLTEVAKTKGWEDAKRELPFEIAVNFS